MEKQIMTTKSRQRRKHQLYSILKKIWPLLIIAVLGLQIGCGDKKRRQKDELSAFDNDFEKLQAEFHSQSMAKLGVDSLSQARRLLNLSIAPINILDEYGTKCVTYEIENVSKYEMALNINWRNLGCRLGVNQKMFTLSGGEVIKFFYNDKSEVTKIKYRSRNLKLHVGQYDFHLDQETDIEFDAKNDNYDFTQDLMVARVEKKEELEWNSSITATISKDLKLDLLVLNNVSIKSSFERFKRNDRQEKSFSEKHKFKSESAEDNEPFINSCGFVSGVFDYQTNYNSKEQSKKVLHAKNRRFHFVKNGTQENRISCNSKDPYIFKTFASHLLQFKSFGRSAVGGKKKKKDDDNKDNDKDKDEGRESNS